MPSLTLGRQSFLFLLLIGVALPISAGAAMLDPDTDDGSSAPVYNTAPLNTDSLKEKLDAARKNSGNVTVPKTTAPVANNVPALVTTKAPAAPQGTGPIIAQSRDPIIHRDVTKLGYVDTTKEAPLVPAIVPAATMTAPVIQDTPKTITASAPVSQQLVQFNGSIAAPVSSDMHDLLFDDVVQKPTSSKNVADNAPVQQMQTVPNMPVQNDYLPAPVPSAVAPIYQAKAKPPVQRMIQAPSAMPIPALQPLPQLSEESVQNPVAAKPAPAYKPPKIAAVEIRKAPKPVSASRFKPMPAKPVAEWSATNMERKSSEKNDALCLLQNRFNNNLSLLIGQSAEGEGLLAIDYGIDMLNSGQEYLPKVEIDTVYSEDVHAYANGPRKLMIQLGKNSPFFAALQSGEALHVSLRGMASTFALTGMEKGLENFSHCVTNIGAPALPAAMAKVPGLVTDQNEMPAVPVPAVVQENITPYSPPVAAPPVMPAPVAAAPQNSFEPQSGYWPDAVTDTMKKSGFVPYQLQKTENQVSWANVDGMLRTTVQRLPVADILDASSLLLDRSEKACGGVFASQMGVPERRGHSDVLQMESKCNRGGMIMVSTWTIVKDALGVTAWQMEAPRDNRGPAFDARQQLLNILAR